MYHSRSQAYHSRITDSTIHACNQVASRVRAARVARLWTQEDLAQRAGVGRATIARIETGTWVPRMRTIRALAEALEVGPADLVPDPGAIWGL